MKLDRALQLRVLTALADAYPDSMSREVYTAIYEAQEEAVLYANLLYLEEHGLIVSGLSRHMGGYGWTPPLAKITAAGLDFILEDGGLSAILGVVTVKLHADTLRDILEARINASSLPPQEKARFIDHLKALPVEALKHLTTQTVEKALDHIPDAMHWLGTQLGL